MIPYEIYVAYISWGVDGKRRPVLVLEEDGKYVRVFRITSQYAVKSDDIKEKYFFITNWQHAGLSKQSYIDIGEKVKIPIALISPKSPIGKLTECDKQQLLAFISAQ